MKKYINQLFMGGLLVAAAAFNSCSSDYLDTNPTSSVTDTYAISTTDNAYNALNGIAWSMVTQQSNYSSHCGEDAIINLWENRPSQNFNHNNFAPGWDVIFNQEFHKRTDSIYDSYAWYYYYQLISQANVIIARIDNASGSDADKKFIKASALTFRAFAYEKLIHYYCYRWEDSNNGASQGLVLRLDESTGDLPYSTLAETYAQIYKDLDEAVSLFNESGIDRPSGEVWIPNVNVAHAVYARAALTKHDYSKAITEAKAARVGYPLMSNDEYTAGFCEPTSEWIFGRYSSAEENMWYWTYGTIYAANGYYASNSSYGAGSIGRELINRIPDGDVRKSLFVTESALGIDASDPKVVEQNYGYIGVKPSGQSWAILNYQAYVAALDYVAAHQAPGLTEAYAYGIVEIDAQLKYWVFDTPGVGYLPFIRSSEMVLIEAEANYKLHQEDAAKAALIELNKTSGRNPDYTCNLSGDALWNEIMDYREVELWGEGFAWSDYKRWNRPVVRHSFAQGGNAHSAVAITIPADGVNKWTWDVPQAETDYNGALNQTALEAEK